MMTMNNMTSFYTPTLYGSSMESYYYDAMHPQQKLMEMQQLAAANHTLKEGDKGLFTGLSNLVGDNVGRLFNLDGNQGKVDAAYAKAQQAILSGDQQAIEKTRAEYAHQAQARDKGRNFGTGVGKAVAGTAAATAAIGLSPFTGGWSLVAVGTAAGAVGQGAASLAQESTDSKQGIRAGVVAGDVASGALSGAVGGGFAGFGSKALAKTIAFKPVSWMVSKLPKGIHGFVKEAAVSKAGKGMSVKDIGKESMIDTGFDVATYPLQTLTA
jgi:hypothetical protein